MGNASRPWMAANCRRQRPMRAVASETDAQVKVKGQKERATEEYSVYGWKVLVLIDVHTRLPLAMKVVKIEEYEGRWLVPLLEQARAQSGHAGAHQHHRHRSWLSGWRGFVAGASKGIIFVIVAKANMAVTQDAQALAKRERAQAREQVVRHGHGKTASQERLRTELVGIDGLTTYDSYGDPGQTQYSYRRDYAGEPINAVVVRRWNNRAPCQGWHSLFDQWAGQRSLCGL